MITPTSLEKRQELYFGIIGEPILIKDLGRSKTLGDLKPVLHTMVVVVKLKYLKKLLFMQTGWLTKIVGLVFHRRLIFKREKRG